MNRIKGFLLCLVLLPLAGILHHMWLGMSGESLISAPARAATLSNGSGQACNGTGQWHFVNNQTGGAWCNFASEDQQAATAVRALLVANASGAARFLWYAWDNHCCVTLFMTERDDTTPTRAAWAYANLEKWLVGNTFGPCTQTEEYGCAAWSFARAGMA